MKLTKLNLAIAVVVTSFVPALVLAPTHAIAQAADDTPAASTADAPATDTPAAATDAPAATDAATTDDAAASDDVELPAAEIVQEQDKPNKKKIVKKKKPKKKIAKKKSQPSPVEDDITQAPVEPVDAASVAPSVAEARASGDLVPMSPSGGEIPLTKVPGNVQSISSAQIGAAGGTEPQEALQKAVPGLIVTDTAGSSFRTQIEYRGFSAGSVTGFPQGFAVYQNGVRINEVFGDVVNFDIIPSNAINDMTIVSGNPVYGLNAIGGGISILMKNGFTFQGVEIDVQGGAHGRRQISTQVGLLSDSGNVSVYFAGQKILEDGFRDFSPVDIERLYADLGFRGSAVEAHFNITWADSSAGVVTAAPEELLNIDWSRTFTSPQITDLEVVMPSVNVKVEATDTLTLSGLAYYRRFKSDVIDGNLFDGEECLEVATDNLGDLVPPPVPFTPAQALLNAGLAADDICSEEIEDGELQAIEDTNGNTVNATTNDIDDPFGVIDNITQKAESWGGSIQGVEKMNVFGLANQFLAGASYDRGNVRYKTSSELGSIGDRFVVDGSGIIIAEPDDFTGRDVAVQTEYIGLYFSNTLDLTQDLALTVGGRWNHAGIELLDLTGEFDGITSNHSFERFNPSIGATYQVMPGMTLYGGYSESNRAPTPAELACANPDNPCPIESFLTDDPPLEQVVTDTWELGLRGKMVSPDGEQKFSWGVGLFRAQNTDDILFVSSGTTGRGFFLNSGNTLRQGVEVGANYSNRWLSLYAGYSFVKATFETANEFQSPSHPLGVPCSGDPDVSCVNVTPGDNIPGIPNHRFKAGFNYWLTEQWEFGTDLIAASGQYHLGDDSNLLAQVGGYTRVDINSSYHLNKNVEIYGFVNNVFDRRYGLFGTLFDTDEATEAAANNSEISAFNNPRSITPAQPISAYGGVKVKF